MPKKFPSLKYSEVVSILLANGFHLTGTVGSHEQYEDGNSHKVTVDKHIPDFEAFLISSMIRQSGLSRDEFYTSTKATAKKINKRFKK